MPIFQYKQGDCKQENEKKGMPKVRGMRSVLADLRSTTFEAKEEKMKERLANTNLEARDWENERAGLNQPEADKARPYA